MKNRLLRTLLLVVLLLLAVVLGRAGGEALASVGWLSFLNAGAGFGLDPTTVDLAVMKLTFGLTVQVNVLQAVLLLLAILFYSKVKIRE